MNNTFQPHQPYTDQALENAPRQPVSVYVGTDARFAEQLAQDATALGYEANLGGTVRQVTVTVTKQPGGVTQTHENTKAD